MNITAFIAIRVGSTRVHFKNFRLLDGKPLYEHITDEMLKSKKINSLYINTDSKHAISIAKKKYGKKLNYFLRKKNLGNSSTTLDQYAYDFMKKIPSDITVFLNPCCLFLKSKTIDDAIDSFINNNLNSCVASATRQTHCFYKNKPINFSFNELQPRTQDLKSVHAATCAFFIWKSSSFKKKYEKSGHANFHGKFASYGLDYEEAIDIDQEGDFVFAESFKKFKKSRRLKPKYHPEIEKLIKSGKISQN